MDNGDTPGEIRHCGSGIKKGTLVEPWALALDAQGNLYESDRSLCRIVKIPMDYRETEEIAVPGG